MRGNYIFATLKKLTKRSTTWPVRITTWHNISYMNEKDFVVSTWSQTIADQNRNDQIKTTAFILHSHQHGRFTSLRYRVAVVMRPGAKSSGQVIASHGTLDFRIGKQVGIMSVFIKVVFREKKTTRKRSSIIRSALMYITKPQIWNRFFLVKWISLISLITAPSPSFLLARLSE